MECSSSHDVVHVTLAWSVLQRMIDVVHVTLTSV